MPLVTRSPLTVHPPAIPVAAALAALGKLALAVVTTLAVGLGSGMIRPGPSPSPAPSPPPTPAAADPIAVAVEVGGEVAVRIDPGPGPSPAPTPAPTPDPGPSPAPAPKPPAPVLTGKAAVVVVYDPATTAGAMAPTRVRLADMAKDGTLAALDASYEALSVGQVAADWKEGATPGVLIFEVGTARIAASLPATATAADAVATLKRLRGQP